MREKIYVVSREGRTLDGLWKKEQYPVVRLVLRWTRFFGWYVLEYSRIKK